MCDFNSGFKPPEMVKNRAVVVVSEGRGHGYHLCSVVPISTVRPLSIEPFHYLLPKGSLPFRRSEADQWVKCDMINTVAYDRLDRLMVEKEEGRRVYETPVLSPNVVGDIQAAIRFALSLVMYRFMCRSVFGQKERVYSSWELGTLSEEHTQFNRSCFLRIRIWVGHFKS